MKLHWPLPLFLLCLLVAPSQAQKTKDGVSLAIKFDRENVSAMVGDGVTWRVLKTIPRADLSGQPIILRAGKMSLKADNSDHDTPNEIGSCHIENIRAMGQTNPNYSPQFKSTTTNPILSAAPVKLASSPRAETKINWAKDQLKITAAANSAAFGEWLLDPQIVDVATYSCRVWKESDKGLSWGPGLALLWSNGQFLLVNARTPLGEWSVTTREGETIVRP